ncbi:uncharacterized protein BO80DRAFT_245822 [Aspergillus ibericus CBS 121593]|uniref:Uncharacterized protein n=1 Tax=Aspergillus ibericus CBS 121593 TaxID=1448316 RepID=A0A395GL25_9EURO|nr:hypothetical protein BO80DRAFT_245822 [Aspergillus ibericus CBS 121593]RAK95996.1 hypothetical protein BO80DRAFT_245822 [Aspergillus ibericus CBS 121593]
MTEIGRILYSSGLMVCFVSLSRIEIAVASTAEAFFPGPRLETNPKFEMHWPTDSTGPCSPAGYINSACRAKFLLLSSHRTIPPPCKSHSALELPCSFCSFL